MDANLLFKAVKKLEPRGGSLTVHRWKDASGVGVIRVDAAERAVLDTDHANSEYRIWDENGGSQMTDEEEYKEIALTQATLDIYGMFALHEPGNMKSALGLISEWMEDYGMEVSVIPEHGADPVSVEEFLGTDMRKQSLEERIRSFLESDAFSENLKKYEVVYFTEKPVDEEDPAASLEKDGAIILDNGDESISDSRDNYHGEFLWNNGEADPGNSGSYQESPLEELQKAQSWEEARDKLIAWVRGNKFHPYTHDETGSFVSLDGTETRKHRGLQE